MKYLRIIKCPNDPVWADKCWPFLQSWSTSPVSCDVFTFQSLALQSINRRAMIYEYPVVQTLKTFARYETYIKQGWKWPPPPQFYYQSLSRQKTRDSLKLFTKKQACFDTQIKRCRHRATAAASASHSKQLTAVVRNCVTNKFRPNAVSSTSARLLSDPCTYIAPTGTEGRYRDKGTPCAHKRWQGSNSLCIGGNRPQHEANRLLAPVPRMVRHWCVRDAHSEQSLSRRTAAHKEVRPRTHERKVEVRVIRKELVSVGQRLQLGRDLRSHSTVGRLATVAGRSSSILLTETFFRWRGTGCCSHNTFTSAQDKTELKNNFQNFRTKWRPHIWDVFSLKMTGSLQNWQTSQVGWDGQGM
jgi:hypothetical protein